MWHVVAGPFLAAAALLVVAGVLELRSPAEQVAALRSVRLPASVPLVRVLAAGEVLVGLAALARPDRWSAALVALAYLAFTGFVGLALARGGVLASCGCFGRPDTPPTRTHLAVTATLALAGLLLAVAPPSGPVWTAATGTDPATLVLAGYAALLAVVGYLVIAVLPTLTPAAVRSASTTRSR